MSSQTFPTRESPSVDEMEVNALFRQLMDNWNKRLAEDFARLFEKESNLIGFDGSQINGRAEIGAHLSQIFTDHQTAAYVWKIRGTRFLTPEVAILRAVAGMVSPGQKDLNPAVNAVQTLVAVKREGRWRIALYQNTPAQFHGRPELSQQLTEELRQLL